MSTTWSLKQFGEEIGPLTEAEFRLWQHEGRVLPDALARRGDTGDWEPAHCITGVGATAVRHAPRVPIRQRENMAALWLMLGIGALPVFAIMMLFVLAMELRDGYRKKSEYVKLKARVIQLQIDKARLEQQLRMPKLDTEPASRIDTGNTSSKPRPVPDDSRKEDRQLPEITPPAENANRPSGQVPDRRRGGLILMESSCECVQCSSRIMHQCNQVVCTT